jgi:hypothetical protein
MLDLNHSDTYLKLIAGLPLEINHLGQLRQLTLKQIATIGESVYFNKYVAPLIFNKDNYEELQELDLPDYEVLANLAYHDPSFKQSYTSALEFFFNDKADLFAENNVAFFYLGELSEKRYINSDSFELIKKAVMKINNLKEPEKYEAGNETARKLIEKIMRNKKKNEVPKKEQINLSSLVSGLAWKPNGINIISVWDLTLVQLYDGYYRTQNIDHFRDIMRGIYAGTVDQKGIDLSKINWANIIKIN